MTLPQLITLNSTSDNRELRIDDAILFGKALTSKRLPYQVIPTIDGVIRVVFKSHFTEAARLAMADGCVTGMSKHELAFWYEFITYQQDIQDGDRAIPNSNTTREAALVQFSEWISDELMGLPHDTYKSCDENYIEEI